jgi:ribosomal protein L37AE/L43A
MIKGIKREDTVVDNNSKYEFCPKCYADLTMQRGYKKSLAYWTCLGCGAMLINPKIESDIVWICDKCGASLNIQPGFNEDCREWKCTECGHSNMIDPSEVYETEEEYEMELKNP